MFQFEYDYASYQIVRLMPNVDTYLMGIHAVKLETPHTELVGSIYFKPEDRKFYLFAKGLTTLLEKISRLGCNFSTSSGTIKWVSYPTRFYCPNHLSLIDSSNKGKSVIVLRYDFELTAGEYFNRDNHLYEYDKTHIGVSKILTDYGTLRKVWNTPYEGGIRSSWVLEKGGKEESLKDVMLFDFE